MFVYVSNLQYTAIDSHRMWAFNEDHELGQEPHEARHARRAQHPQHAGHAELGGASGEAAAVGEEVRQGDEPRFEDHQSQEEDVEPLVRCERVALKAHVQWTGPNRWYEVMK